ncbi:glycosyltransferase family 61 protein [Leptothoe spongobia]|uniref:Glycosyltransferase family 61 protein n=1 Tax=Leptothoe spongobia TAU-MAC 1115 TaxID=1967444 RepID=A0A947GJN0_9CYAN|nr:glycosyltransferase family 61 protein [Leptothoe spongobia]MBT9316123.1 glycosyltransferase family 61 protein [Leptothoe spongobia TAU-MAC 1115]
MNATNSTLMQSEDAVVTVLRVKAGYTNDKGEVYDRDGRFIDFPRELGSKQRLPLDPSSVDKQFRHQRVACVVQERRNYSYYHWTYETLPKLIYLSNKRKEFKVDKLYFHFGYLGHPYQRQALRRLGFSYCQVLDAKRIKSLMAQEIVVVKLNETRLEPSNHLCRAIKAVFINRPVKEPYRKIYLTRDHIKTGRKLINEIELRELLDAYGFQIVIAEKLTVAAQAKLFNESKYVISPHGAALANIAFCEPGTKILELFNQTNRSMWSPLYSRIAKSCDLELRPIPPKQLAESMESNHRSNFHTDLVLIKAALTEWGL